MGNWLNNYYLFPNELMKITLEENFLFAFVDKYAG